MARVVSAYLTNNRVSPRRSAQLDPDYRPLQPLRQPASVAQATPAIRPAVPIKRSVTPTTITCLICGQVGRMLKRHLACEHGSTPDEYRKVFGLPSEYPRSVPAVQDWL
ncbi:MucR family transcriptional regulator [Azospirillum sp. A26]|uniref:MucR family transcriptional regulator n=1 Tax=Azospirillum sp. A26 TaxID=3160607 RepID=UPI0036709491